MEKYTKTFGEFINEANEIEDELNPDFIFNNVKIKLLVDIVNGKIDCKKPA